MLKKALLLGFIIIMLVTMASMSFADITILDQTGIENGYFTVSVNTENEIRVLVNKEDQKTVYTLNETSNLPLQFGKGIYEVRVYEKINGRFRLIEEKNISLDLENENVIYLNSVQNINWNLESEAVKIASKLTEGLESNMEKVVAIHNYVISNISYDYIKARTVTGTYIPSIDLTLENKNGICYDYSSLFASMLRSVDIPTKVAVGHVGTTYHAWNEVYLAESDSWITIDSTSDALYNKYGIAYELAKTSVMYDVEITY